MTAHEIIIYTSSGVRVIIAGLVIYKLLYRFNSLNKPERAGLCLLGGSSLLTIPPMLQTEVTPFDDWAGLTFVIGIAAYLIGRIMRTWNRRR